MRGKVEMPTGVSVQELANRLGIERRMHVRVNYPELGAAGLPRVQLNGVELRVQDISVGGCCLLDPAQVFNAKAGQDLALTLIFNDQTQDLVLARLLTLVHDRRHIQFHNFSERRQDQLRDQMVYGVRAAQLKLGLAPLAAGSELIAREVWSSLQGDALVFEEHPEKDAFAVIAGASYVFYRHGYPRDQFGRDVGPRDLNALILFLANIASPSESVRHQLRQLEILGAG